MALTCPRCGTDVPKEALCCPYCSLPKPKRGFAAGQDKSEQTSLPERRKPSVKPVKTNPNFKKPVSGVTAHSGKPLRKPSPKLPRKLRMSVLSVAALMAVFSVGIYIFVVPLVYSEQAEPKTVLAALDKLRKTPSNEPELTIDALLSRQLETSRRVKNLVAYQGWSVRPIKGTRTKVILVFSYEEVGGVQHTAEWIADLTNNTFAPQSELAAAVSSKEPGH